MTTVPGRGEGGASARDGRAIGEFELIERYFSAGVRRDDVRLGVGDDGAVVRPPHDRDLALVVDTVVAGVHFPEDAPAAAIGHRALAVNLSDLAAMGAEPAWMLLALTLPRADEDWLAGFAEGLAALAAPHRVALVGGDTTRGPLTATVQLTGFVERPLRRDGARPGDRIWVSGTLGAGAGGLHGWQSGGSDAEARALVERFLYPEPRVALGRALGPVVSSAIDISDGLVADAGHVARASGVRLALVAARVPLAPGLQRILGDEDARQAALHGGDDYELLFTAAPEADAAVRKAAAWAGVAVTAIGRVAGGAGVTVDGRCVAGGYDHFGQEAR